MNCVNCNNDLFISKVVARRDEIRFNCYNTRKKIVQCKQCGLVQLTPQWAQKELDKIYLEYNKKSDFEGQKNISKRISKYLNYYIFEGDRILEVGCGAGDNVKYFRKKMYSVMGIDKDSSVEDLYGGVYNYDIFDKKLDKDLAEHKFDFIYSLHVLEHMKDPIKFIERLKELTAKKGTILLEFPNLEDPLLSVYKIKEFEKFYYRPDHHFFFTPQTIANMLYRNKIVNCTIERRQNYGIVNHLNWLIRKKPTNLRIEIPILDSLYKWVLCKILKKSDSIILVIKKEL